MMPCSSRRCRPSLVGAVLCALTGLMLAPGALAQTDQDYSDEYNLQWALEAIKADAAYQYF